MAELTSLLVTAVSLFMLSQVTAVCRPETAAHAAEHHSSVMTSMSVQITCHTSQIWRPLMTVYKCKLTTV